MLVDVTSCGFASKGYLVLSSDVDAQKIAKINEGTAPFHEANLTELLSKSLHDGNFKSLPNGTQKAVQETDITYIAVGTPSKPDGSIDLKFIEAVSHDIGKALKEKETYHVVVVKSTGRSWHNTECC